MISSHASKRFAGLIAIAFAAVFALVGCIGQTGVEASPHANLPVPVYVRDPAFPQPSTVKFSTVSWVRREPRTGNIYVLQRSQPVVSVWSPKGNLISSWTTSALGDPHSISFHTDTSGKTQTWITDMAPPNPAGPAEGHCLKAFDLSGRPLSTIGTCGANSQGTGLDPVQFDEVTDIAWNSSGQLLVSDGDVGGLNNRVLTLNPSGRVLAHWSAPDGHTGSGPGQFNLPHALLVDACDRIWVADALNHRVQVLAHDGTPLGDIATFGSLGVYALAFGQTYASPSRAVLFVGASPSTGGGTGRVSLFMVPMDCAAPHINASAPFASFEVPLPTSTTTTLLHALTVDPDTWDVTLAVLGSGVPPQRWVATWPNGRPPSVH
ncbi:hypothetical protein [Burkholderia sp. Ax-1719]|uniref:hypothetical protein n=1 Tax=Burkholderia sp. Ax-1719 TaxID=2608334 RepID=UPI0014219014|nr:hypothetical protein [Burkholderia sp. Ax-1719]NIE63206.1 hypothetical protein [Burkholderia sp. Ax-1719]